MIDISSPFPMTKCRGREFIHYFLVDQSYFFQISLKICQKSILTINCGSALNPPSEFMLRSPEIDGTCSQLQKWQ